MQHGVSPEAVRLICSAEAAVRHAAKLLGRTTHAANHQGTVVMGDDGQHKVVLLRDAMPAPTGPKRRLSPKPRASASAAAVDQPQEASSDGLAALPPPLKARKVLTSGQAHLARVKCLEEQRLRLRVDEIGSSLRTRPGAATASDRIADLRRRIDLRSRPEES